jgi:galactonate dehydratase
MKLAEFDLIHVRPRYLLLKIVTDQGLVGWGEPTLEGRARTVATAVAELLELIRGEDLRRIEHLVQRMHRSGFYRGGPVLCSAISGIEQALWDVLGKSLGVPVWQLLGGPVRDRIHVYRQVRGKTIDESVASAQSWVEAGYDTLKMSIFEAVQPVDSPRVIEEGVAWVAAVREAVGADVALAVDAHGRLSPAMAIRAAEAMERYEILFLEEPCLPENVEALAHVASSTSIPVATGERLYTRFGFRPVLEQQAAALVQPDLSHCGGIFEGRKIAAMAEAYYVGMAPHCPLSVVSLAACLQLAACTPNFVIQECLTLGQELLVEPLAVVDSHIAVPSGPGLGIAVDEQKVAALRYAGDWQTPEFRHSDGSVADW